MNPRHVAVLIFSGLIGLGAFKTTSDQPPASGHPEITYPDHVSSVESIVNAALETISGPRGEARDWDKYRGLFFPDARLISTRIVHDTAIVESHSVDEFIEGERKYLEGAGYFEKPIALKVQQFDHIAHVMVSYESRRREEDDKPYARGVYSIQLVESARRWWILSMMWQAENKNVPIPEEFLDQ